MVASGLDRNRTTAATKLTENNFLIWKDEVEDFELRLKFRLENTHEIANFAEFQDVLATSGGFLSGYFGGSKEDEKAIKEATGATPRCFPLADQSTGTCFYTGRKGARRVIFAKAY